MEYYSALEEGNLASCNNMDESGGNYAKWNSQIEEDIIYMWNFLKKESLTHRNKE